MANQKIKRSKAVKWIFYTVLGLFSFCGFLLANLPAQTLWQYLPHDRVELKGISGTPWSGMVESLLINSTKSPLLLPAVRWQMDLSQLLQGKLVFNVHIGGAALPVNGYGTIMATQAALTLENVAFDTTAQWLVNASGQPLPASVAGNVFLQLDELTVNNTGCLSINGEAQLAQSQLESTLGKFDLGNTTANLNCQGGELVAQIIQSSSLFKSQGNLRIGINGRYAFVGNIRPKESMPVSLRKGLNMFVSADASGSYLLNFRGVLN